MLYADRFVHPTRTRYKQRDSILVDTILPGDYYRTNWILAEYRLLNKYPSVHEGDDIVGMGFNCYGDEVLAVANGVVIHSELVPTGTWYNMITIEHTFFTGMKIYSRYAHLKDRLFQVGDEVKVGQTIGHMNGRSRGMADHLHFAICVTDLLVRDPRNWPSSLYPDPYKAKAYILEHYLDPLFYIDSRIAMEPVPDPAEDEDDEVIDVTSKDMWVNTPGSRLNLRAQPSTSAAIIGKIEHGQKLTGYDLIDGNYQLVKTLSLFPLYGFVDKRFLSAAPV